MKNNYTIIRYNNGQDIDIEINSSFTLSVTTYRDGNGIRQPYHVTGNVKCGIRNLKMADRILSKVYKSEKDLSDAKTFVDRLNECGFEYRIYDERITEFRPFNNVQHDHSMSSYSINLKHGDCLDIMLSDSMPTKAQAVKYLVKVGCGEKYLNEFIEEGKIEKYKDGDSERLLSELLDKLDLNL